MKDTVFEKTYTKLWPEEREVLSQMIGFGMAKPDALQAVITMVNRNEIEKIRGSIYSLALSEVVAHFLNRLLDSLHGYLADHKTFIRESNIKVMLCNLPYVVGEHKPYWFNGLSCPDYTREMINNLYPDNVEGVA